MDSIIKDPALAPAGQDKIAWVKDFMPVLNALNDRYSKEKPFAGVKIAASIHLEAKSAYLCQVLKNAGAEVAVTGCNPLSTKDDVCAALAQSGVAVRSWFGMSEEEYFAHIEKTLEFKPHLIIDDGGDFVSVLHGSHPEYAAELIGGCEETTTGIHRLRGRAKAGKLNFPMMNVNDANCKHLFDNRHGTGQSVWDGIMSATNNMVTGKTVVVAGYGFCSSGIAARARGLGANVIVTEVDPYRAIEAAMDGFRVLHMDDAAPLGDVFVTATGCKEVLTKRHFARMKHNALLANAGHFDVEISKPDLESLCVRKFDRKPFIEGYELPDGRVLNLLADGRLVNIVAGNGHPAEIMDMSFGIQFLSALYMLQNGRALKPDLYEVPEEIDREVARIKIGAMGLGLDVLTPEQQRYLDGEY